VGEEECDLPIPPIVPFTAGNPRLYLLTSLISLPFPFPSTVPEEDDPAKVEDVAEDGASRL
jgi:hypothetical protein